MSEKLYPKCIVGVIVYNDEGKFVLGKMKKWNDNWICPGGHVEWGETLENAVKREIKEELGIKVDNIQPIGVQESIFSSHQKEQKHYIFLDYMCRYVSGEIVLNDEIQEYRWFTPEQALSLELTPSIRQIITSFMNTRK